MTSLMETAGPLLADGEGLTAFCEELLGTLTRSDQRKWGETYVRGLLSVPGRKSIRRIADHVVGRPVDQCLQQFVNQSPWRWDDVRRTLARQAAPIRPRAWLVQEAIFPKNGGSSVGVARQYVASIGRTLNCQRGLVVFLANGAARCPVNWRLAIPKSWEDDSERRARARIPDQERSLPFWRYLIDAVDEMVAGWGLRPAPVVWDATGHEARPVVRALTERRMSYVIQVSEHTPVLPATLGAGPARMLTAGELAELSVGRRQVALRVRDRSDGGAVGVQYSALSICDTCPPENRIHLTSACHHVGTRRVLAEWSSSPGGFRLRSMWLTNLNGVRLPQLAGLVETSLRARQSDLDRLRDDFGLQDFEGRSFAGWHHHVTLVSAAQVYHTLRQLAAGPGHPDTVYFGQSGYLSANNFQWRGAGPRGNQRNDVALRKMGS
jgi:SRSO17 transposase